MIAPWLAATSELCAQEADFYSGARKILRNRTVTFYGGDVEDDLTIADSGFTKMKMNKLIKDYKHPESIAVAISLWERRKAQRKYGSVGFTCYNHFLKADPEKKSKRASVMGPCIQAVTLTLLNDRTTAVDVFYRTTEWFKKFPADLVFLRDELLGEFDFDGAPISEINFHFANITLHPMYFVTILPLSDDPVQAFEDVRPDERFWVWCIKWTARYLCEEYEHGISKFAQALRVQKDARERLTPAQIALLAKYIRKHHPGIRGHDH